MLVAPFFSLYDVTLANGHRGWDGNGFYLAVFGGFTYSVAFLISFGKRALDAFGDLAAANVTLERRIAETRAELSASEAARQELVVGQALAGERERLMQEMHDGIGSNLITALAVARQQNQPQATITTLGRALADLKITVDSLEPVEGDLVALIGNLRHRMAGDLRDAGVICRWEVEPCRPLAWLDATNALHVLRIFQEAIGNVLTHSGASEIRIGCREQTVDDVAGIAAYVADNGRGFDAAGELPGKGLANIRARARSLHGVLSSTSDRAAGTMVTLWLPYERQM
jgi:signal transduction histidine kinase